MPEEKSRPKFRYQDLPELPETFADSVGDWSFEGGMLRVEFLVSRLDPPKASEPRTGRKLPACRLVLTAPGALELINQCRLMTAALEKAGVVTREKKKAPVAN